MGERARLQITPAIAGIWWAMLGTFSFSLLVALGKLAGVDAHVPALQIVFLRYLGGLVLVVVIAVDTSRSRGRRP